MIINQLESEGAQVTLLDPLEIQAPLLAQPLHWMKVNIAQPPQSEVYCAGQKV